MRAPALLRRAPHAVLAAAVAGCAGAGATGSGGWWALALGGCLSAAAAVGANRGAGRAALALLAVGALSVGWGWGGVRMHQTAVHAATATFAVDARLVVESRPSVAPDGSRVSARVIAIDVPATAGGAGLRLLLDLPRDARFVPAPGQIVRAVGRLGPPAGDAAPGWWRRYLQRRLVAARLRAHRVEPVGRRGGVQGLRDRIRNALAASAGSGLSGDTAEIVRGMALGGGAGISDQTADRWRRAGIWHLLAVSGQNIGFVALGVMLLLGALGVARRGAAVGAILVIVVYCLSCDGGASVARAGIVGCLVLTAQLVGRARDRWYLVLVGLGVLLGVQPRSVGDPGLQLSFAAVAGLMTIAPALQEWLEGMVLRPVAPYVAQSLAASLATAPVAIAHFGTVSPVGLAVNVVVVPMAGPIVVLALVGAVVGALVPPLALVPTQLAGLGADAIQLIARVAAAIPGASVRAPIVATAVACVLAVGIPLAAWWLWSADPWTKRWPARPAVGVAVVIVAIVGVGVLIRRSRGTPWPRVPTLTVLDVGQGDAILLRSPDGAAALVDTGPPGSPPVVVGRLRNLGVRRLDLVALTHDQADHVGAAGALVKQLAVGRFVAPLATGAAERIGTRIGHPVGGVSAGDRLRVGAWTLTIVWPSRQGHAETPNDGALVILAQVPGLRALLTADAEGNVLRHLTVGHVDVLKVAHHGSDDPDLGGVLARLTPAVGVISVGRHNTFGHPTGATLATLASRRVAVWRTDHSGDVSVAAGAAGLAVSPAR